MDHTPKKGAKTIKLLENIGLNIHELGLGNATLWQQKHKP